MKACTCFAVVTSAALLFCLTADSYGTDVVYETFEDGSVDDDTPVTWVPWKSHTQLTVDGDDLVFTADATSPFASVYDLSLTNTSIRTQLRLMEGGGAGVSVYNADLDQQNRPSGYFSFVLDNRIGEIGITGGDGSVLKQVSTKFDPTSEDVVMQLDVLGDAVSLWVWPPDEGMPDEPLITVVDPTISATWDTIGIGGISSTLHYPESGPVEIVYRYVYVADEHITELPGPLLRAGDADQSLEFDQRDLVQVLVAAKYMTGQPATWGEGDWDGAPGGAPGSPPPGNGLFDQIDIVAALGNGKYMSGPYAAVSFGGRADDDQTSVIYNAITGEMGVDAPAGRALTSVNIDSATGIFTGDPAQNLGGSFDNDSDTNLFKATFGTSFRSLNFGPVAQPGLSQELVAGDLTVVGSLEGGGELGPVDLVYVPEPMTVVPLVLGLAVTLARRRRRSS
jgi:hypothetical protein